MNKLLLLAAALTFTTAQSTIKAEWGDGQTAPSQIDMDAYTWLNRVRAEPTIIIPDLKRMLCQEYNPVPSPGFVYDAALATCTFFNDIWGYIFQLFGGDATMIFAQGREKCDASVRATFFLPAAEEPTCKVTNMNGTLYMDEQGRRINTNEGIPVITETIAFLKSQKKLPTPLRWNPQLWKSCRDHVNDQGVTGATGHTGADGSSPFVRMQRYSNYISPAGENLMYGSLTGKDAVISLIIDDGVPSRGHRTNIFNEAWNDVGNYFGNHLNYGKMLCQNFAYGSYDIALDSYSTLYDNFMSEAVTFTAADGAPQTGWTQQVWGSSIELVGWTMVKKAYKNYTMSDGSIKHLEKIINKELPNRKGIYLQ